MKMSARSCRICGRALLAFVGGCRRLMLFAFSTGAHTRCPPWPTQAFACACFRPLHLLAPFHPAPVSSASFPSLPLCARLRSLSCVPGRASICAEVYPSRLCPQLGLRVDPELDLEFRKQVETFGRRECVPCSVDIARGSPENASAAMSCPH